MFFFSKHSVWSVLIFLSNAMVMDCSFPSYGSSALLFSVTACSETRKWWDVLCCWSHTDLQPAAVSIPDGPSEDGRHIAYYHSNAFTWTQFKFTLTNRQVVDLQTGKCRSITWFYNTLYVHFCMCACMQVSVFLLVQAISDFAYKEQGFLSLQTWVSGMLECCLNHFGGFLIHWQQHTNSHHSKSS